MSTTEDTFSQEIVEGYEPPEKTEEQKKREQAIRDTAARFQERMQESLTPPRSRPSAPSPQPSLVAPSIRPQTSQWDFQTPGEEFVEREKKTFYPGLHEATSPNPALLDTPRATEEDERRESPLNFLQSEKPPEGWQPTPQDISRLMDEGLLHKDDVNKPEWVWMAGRASAERSRAPGGWFQKASGDALVEEVRSGESAIQKAIWGTVPMNSRVVRGDIVINTAKMYRDTHQIHRTKLLRELAEDRGMSFQQLSPEEQQEIEEKARRRTQLSVAVFMNSGTRMFYTDRFDRDITQEIKNSSGLTRIWKLLTSPTQYGAVGASFPDTQEGDIARMQATLSPGQLKTESFMSKFGRMSLSTLWSPMVFGGHEWMSEDYIDAVRAGDELILHIGDIAERIDGVGPGEETSTAAKWTSGVGVGAIIIGEPDILSLALLPFGLAAKGLRVAKAASIAGKARRSAETLRRLRQAVENGEELPEVAKRLGAYDEAVKQAVQLRALSEWNLNEVTRVRGTGGVEEAERLYQQADAAAKKADDLRDELATMSPELLGAETEARRALLEFQAAEEELFVAYARREMSEVQKNEFLQLFGLSPEEAARIQYRKDVPSFEQGARNAEKAAKEIRKRARALRKVKANKALLDTYDRKARELGSLLRTMEEGFYGVEEATTKGGKKLRAGWEVLTGEALPLGKISRTGEPFRIPVYGQQIRIPTERGGTALRVVEGIEIRGPKTKKLSDGPDNRIILKVRGPSGEIEEFVHPFRIKKQAAENLRTKILEFEETHKILTADGGLMDELTTLDRLAAQADEYAASLRIDGPAGLKLQEFEDTSQALIDASKRYKKAAKDAKLPEKNLEKLTKDHTGKGKALVRAELEALEKGNMRRVYADALEDTARGLDNFIDTGLKNIGIMGFKGPKQIAQSIKGLVKMSGDDLKTFGMKVSDRKVEEGYREILKKNSTFKAQEKGRKEAVVEFDADGIIRDLIPRMGGAENLYKFVQTPEGAGLLDLFEAGVRRKTTTVGLRGETASKVQQSIREAVRHGEARKLFTDDVVWGRAIHEAWRDLGLENRSTRLNRLKNMASYFPLVGKKFRGSFKNVGFRVGEYSKDVEEAFMATERLLNRGRMELLEIGRLEEFGDTPYERLSNWLDYQGEVRLREGTSQWSVATGLGTPYEKGALAILADRRIDPRTREIGAAELSQRARTHRRTLENLLRKSLGKTLDDGTEITQDFIDEAVEAAGEITEDLMALTPDGGVSGAPLSLTAVSRMWLPRGEGIDVTPEQGRLLMGLARKFLQSSNTFGPAKNALGEVVDAGFSEKMRKATFAILGRTESSFARANAFAAGGFQAAATMGTLSHRLGRASGLRISAEQATDINRIMMGDVENVKDMPAAMDALNRMGMPFTQKSVDRGVGSKISGSGGGVDLKTLVEVGSDPSTASFVPLNLLKELERKAGRLSKELESFSPSPRDASQLFYNRAVQGYLSLWRGSAVTGLWVPNPRYWTNNMMGDFSQMWEEVGFARAAQRSFINAPTNLPFVGRWLQTKTLYMAEKVAGKSGRGQALPGIIDTWTNPWLGRVFKGEKGQFVTKNGDIVTYDQARTWAIEDGISEAFVREELMDMYSRTAGDFDAMGTEMGKWWKNDGIYYHAAQTQERQRVALYLDMIQRGATRKEAAEATKRALYDWSHGIAEWEARTIARIVPFWRFWRLRLKQTEQSFIEPFVRPADEYAKKALRGNTRLARLRQQTVIFPSLPDFVYQDNPHAGMTENEKVDMLARQLYPTWADTKPKLGIVPWSPIRRMKYLERTGKEMTHGMITLPMGSSLDGFDMATALYTGMFMVANETAKTLKLPHAEFQAPGDVAARFFEPILGGMMPLPESAIRALMSDMNVDLDFQIRGADRYLSPEEEQTWKKFPDWMPVLGAEMQFDHEAGRYKVPQETYWAWRALPFTTTQIQPWIGAFSSPEWDEGLKQGLWAATKRLTGIGREIPFNVNKEIDGRRRDMQEQFKRFVKTQSATMQPYRGRRREGLPDLEQRWVDEEGRRTRRIEGED
jgi:tetratricopeptide (TPR) repeat protein